MERRAFLQNAAGTIGGLTMLGVLPPMLGAQEARPDLVVAIGTPADKLVRTAIDALGGIKRFISKGDVVVVKPNIGWDRTPELAANTNPAVVAAVVRLCLETGAKKVKVFDRTCDDPRRCYTQSGIEAAAKAAGAEVTFVGGRSLSNIDQRKYRRVEIPDGKTIKSWPILIDVLEADKLINIPIAKHHGAGKLTMALKNWMGVMGDNRGHAHQDLNGTITDLATIIKADLTILDAVRILTAHGPKGGDLADVKRLDTIIAGVDQVAVDAYGATLFGKTAADLPYLTDAAKRGLGKTDLTKLAIKRIQI